MQHDRDYYRSQDGLALLRHAREEGLNPEMAIAITEKLARQYAQAHTLGQYHFNHSTGGN